MPEYESQLVENLISDGSNETSNLTLCQAKHMVRARMHKEFKKEFKSGVNLTGVDSIRFEFLRANLEFLKVIEK